MKLKMIVLDMELSKRGKRILGACVGGALLFAGGIAYGGPSLHVWADGETLDSADLNGNFSQLDGRVAALESVGAKPSVAVSAANTAAIQPVNGTWTTIPGLSVSFNLTQNSLVQPTASGVQRTFDTNASSLCEVWYRYVIDGVPRGDTSGQRVQVSNGAASWHQGWTLSDFADLAPGAHIVEVQVQAGPLADCYVCGEFDGSAQSHDGCTLNVVAVAQ